MTPGIAALLAELQSRDIHVWIEDGRLRCGAPTGVLTAELRERLSANKAALLDFLHNADALNSKQRAIVPLQPLGERPPVFAVAGHNGNVFCFRTLARCLGPEQPFYGLQPPGADGQGQPLETVEEVATYFAEQIRAFRPEGPYLLAGFCAGGTVAVELAQQLRRTGSDISVLALIASPHPHEFRRLPSARRYLKELWQRVGNHAPALRLPLPEQGRYLAGLLSRHQAHRAEQERRRADPVLAQTARIQRITLAALARYRLEHYPGRVHLFLPGREWTQAGGLAARWRGWGAHIEEYYSPSGRTSDDLLHDTHCPAFAELFRLCLDSHGQPRSRSQGDRHSF